jgi:hypothetical protein
MLAFVPEVTPVTFAGLCNSVLVDGKAITTFGVLYRTMLGQFCTAANTCVELGNGFAERGRSELTPRPASAG